MFYWPWLNSPSELNGVNLVGYIPLFISRRHHQANQTCQSCHQVHMEKQVSSCHEISLDRTLSFRVIKLRMPAFASHVNDPILFKNSYDFSKFQWFRHG